MISAHPSPAVRRTVLIAVPVVLGLLELGHPGGRPGEPVYDRIAPIAVWWTTLHLVQLPLFALLGVAVLWIAGNSDLRSAKIARACMPVFIVLYPAFDAAVGIASGVLVIGAGPSLTAAQIAALNAGFQALFWGPITGMLYVVAGLSWLVGTVAAALAARYRGAPTLSVVLLMVAAIAFAVGHIRPVGPVACFSFAAAAILLELGRAPATAPANT